MVTSTVGTNRAIAYNHLCQWLIDGFATLGIPLHFGASRVRSSNKNNPNCFGLATGADLCLPDGVKVIGSAQVWRGETVLQHGTIMLNPDPDLFELAFETPLPRSTFEPWHNLMTRAGDCGGGDRLHQKLCTTLKEAAQKQWAGTWEEGRSLPTLKG